MPQYRISQAARLMGVSPDTMRRWADAGRVRAVNDAAGHRSIEGTELARLATELAGEHDPGLGRGAGQSARNHISGIVTRVKKDEVAALVELQAGPYRLVSLITREAVDELGLEPGMMADAVVKATNVSVEVPRPR
ncbi:MAG TPA: helix-turn-helix transcriptional regulator [Acidimicrobiales bacterium]|nr:helix-turn-helix transcriptional regulator [Acidimicrobiales bacterium]